MTAPIYGRRMVNVRELAVPGTCQTPEHLPEPEPCGCIPAPMIARVEIQLRSGAWRPVCLDCLMREIEALDILAGQGAGPVAVATICRGHARAAYAAQQRDRPRHLRAPAVISGAPITVEDWLLGGLSSADRDAAIERLERVAATLERTQPAPGELRVVD